MPRHRRFVPLRSEAMQVAELLRGDLAHHWTVRELCRRMVGKHHEIYLSDPRRAAPENLHTILRQPVLRA